MPRFHLTGLLIVLLTVSAVPAIAQDDDPPTPQLLYRDGTRLLLLDGYTGETEELPFAVSEWDTFTWSPDGRYLLAQLRDENTWPSCINLYDLDNAAWLYDEPIACEVGHGLFSGDNTQLVYSVPLPDDPHNAALRLHSLSDETDIELYRTLEGNLANNANLANVEWSPTEAYLTFISYKWIMGGTLNRFVVMNTDNFEYVTINAPNIYYASYKPIWSPDDSRFIMRLQGEYAYSGAIPTTNHSGDVYLFDADTGEEFRVTYSPAMQEFDLRWTDEGEIAYSTREVIIHQTQLTIAEAMNVDPVAPEDMVTPEPIRQEDYFSTPIEIVVSPDPSLAAWIDREEVWESSDVYRLYVGSANGDNHNYVIRVWDEDDFFGWRPSDYDYPQG